MVNHWKTAWKRVAASVLLGLLAACASIHIDETFEVGKRPLCADGVNLGAIAVRLETQWRPDQKEPAQLMVSS